MNTAENRGAWGEVGQEHVDWSDTSEMGVRNRPLGVLQADCKEEVISRCQPYPVDFLPSLILSKCDFDTRGVPYHAGTKIYDPTTIAHYALAHVNLYLASSDQCNRDEFLAQAYWLLEHETRSGDDTCGWPISSSQPTFPTKGSWLSALAQGCGISVLVRAYQLTREEAFLTAAHRAVRTFERDILDGGVSTPIGSEGIFFEEVAVYPAAHSLSGCIFALLGLYDYVELTRNSSIEVLIARSLTTLHSLLDEYDTGYWTRSNLLNRRLASESQLVEQSLLLTALSRYSSCKHCLALAARWHSYSHRFASRLRYRVNQCLASGIGAVWKPIQTALFPSVNLTSSAGTSPDLLRVCVPITAFPVTGGMRAALASVAQVTGDVWEMEYLTQYVGPNFQHLVIHRFGTTRMAPWQFPAVWLYVLAGCKELLTLLRRDARYALILPQDGIFTAAFAALAAKLAGARNRTPPSGVRVVCMDYGNMTVVRSLDYRNEREKNLASKTWPTRLTGRLRFTCYWPSLYLFAWIAARLVDHFLVAGIAGDGVEDLYCGQLGVHPEKITRYPYMIDIERHIILDAASRMAYRAKHSIAADAIVITMICRLSPEKGIDIALESISEALAALSAEERARVRVIIAGDGPLRKFLEEDIGKRKLNDICLLWGEASREEVVSLLAISDVFLHTSTRGAYYTMSILEAMASRCAILASDQPSLNVQLLAEGRGVVVPAGDAVQTGKALVQLVQNPDLRCQMGSLARDYIAEEHSPIKLRRVLMRATYWSALDTFLEVGKGE